MIRAAAAGSGPFYVRTGRGAAAVSLPPDGEPPLVNSCARRPDLGHAHLCFVDHASLTAVAEELRATRYSRFVVVEEHRPTGGVASTLALLVPEVAVVGVNAGMAWPSEGGDHGEVLGLLGLDLAQVMAAAA